MKTKLFLFITALFGGVFNGFSQSQIALESGSTTTFHSTIDAAITNAVNGDVIYLPGGSFTPSGTVLIIDKNIDIIGVGHYPDSTLATGQTILNGSVSIRTGADGGSIQGLYIIGTINFGSDASNQVVNGFSISRCYASQTTSLSFDNNAANTSSMNINLSENVLIGVVHLAEASNLFITKNIFQNYVKRTLSQVVFSNNVFLVQTNFACSSTPTFHDVNGAIFNNNIVTNGGCSGISAGTFSGNAFYNNIFSANITFPYAGNPGSGNLINQVIGDIFVNQSTSTFSYDSDYHLKVGSPGIAGGSDGTDIGLYGTLYPYKEGAVPFNPHVSSKSIAPQTNPQGNLNISIQVGAQQN
jgi:hypothetical protein